MRVDVEEEQDGNGLINVKYKVHPDHNNNTACEENCKIVNIADHRLIHPDVLLEGPFLPACDNLIQSRFHQLIALLSSIMKSSRYCATIQFPCQDSSTPELVMILWPDSLSEINKKVAHDDKLTTEDKDSLCSYVDSNFTASLDSTYISQAFNISIESAEKIAELAKTCQYHNIFARKLPSNVTLVKEIPRSGLSDQMTLIRTWVDLLETFNKELDKLPQEAFSPASLKTLDDFLKHLEQSEGYSLREEDNFFQLKISPYHTFKLEKDEMLQKLLQHSGFSKLCAIYHRAVAVLAKHGVEIVLKRPSLRECYTLQYTPLILLAAESTVEMQTIGTDQKEAASLVSQAEKIMPQELHEFAADHTEVSVEEAIWLIDPKKKIIKRNTKPVYINTRENKKLKFRKADIPNPLLNFTDIDDGVEFQLVKDIHDIYLERPGAEGAVLDQFLMSYKDDNEEGESVNEEGESVNEETPWIVTCQDYPDPPERMPAVIVHQSGKRFTLRKVPGVVSYPTPPEDTDDYVHQMVVLYHPHRTYAEVNVKIEELKKIFFAKDSNPKLDGKGKEMTKLETVRSTLHPQLNQKLWKELFNENDDE